MCRCTSREHCRHTTVSRRPVLPRNRSYPHRTSHSADLPSAPALLRCRHFPVPLPAWDVPESTGFHKYRWAVPAFFPCNCCHRTVRRAAPAVYPFPACPSDRRRYSGCRRNCFRRRKFHLRCPFRSDRFSRLYRSFRMFRRKSLYRCRMQTE